MKNTQAEYKVSVISTLSANIFIPLMAVSLILSIFSCLIKVSTQNMTIIIVDILFLFL